MTLAARLDRLRGAAGNRAATAETETLQRLARARARATGAAASPARLARALALREVAPGLLLAERTVPLAGGPRPRGDLAGLPEYAGLAGDPTRAGRPTDWLYLDLETTGLSGGVGNLAFMVGAARLRDGRRLAVRQYLLAGFAAEGAMLDALAGWVGPGAVVVSYNGKGFDVPVLQARACLKGLAFDWSRPAHLDLLYTVRRAYRRCWPDCRLQTAERRLLDIRRVDDLPGAEAPAAWRAWLRGGAVDGLRGVLRHNLQDLVSLALLHRVLPAAYAPGGLPARDGVDYRAIGQAWRAAGRADLAERVWRAAGERLDGEGRLALAALYRDRGDWPSAERIWLALHRDGDARAASALSKYYEHRRRDYGRAMCFAADCDPRERAARTARLARKLDRDPALPLTGGAGPGQKAMK